MRGSRDTPVHHAIALAAWVFGVVGHVAISELSRRRQRGRRMPAPRRLRLAFG
jgi:hypothetical protein